LWPDWINLEASNSQKSELLRPFRTFWKSFKRAASKDNVSIDGQPFYDTKLSK